MLRRALECGGSFPPSAIAGAQRIFLLSSGVLGGIGSALDRVSIELGAMGIGDPVGRLG